MPKFAPAQHDFVAYVVLFPIDFYDEIACECIKVASSETIDQDLLLPCLASPPTLNALPIEVNE
eukprot:4482526-Amphidinium_carterae.1